MATKNQQTEMQQVISFLKPHICPSGLKDLKQYAKFSIKEAWNKCTSSENLLAFKLISVYGKDRSFKNEFAKAIKLIFKEISEKIEVEALDLPTWVDTSDVDLCTSNIKFMKDEILECLTSNSFDDYLGVSNELEEFKVHDIVKKHIKPPTLQDVLNIKVPDTEQKFTIKDWNSLTDERQFELLVQYKLYNSAGKRLFK
jgi:hypothetical protein